MFSYHYFISPEKVHHTAQFDKIMMINLCVIIDYHRWFVWLLLSLGFASTQPIQDSCFCEAMAFLFVIMAYLAQGDERLSGFNTHKRLRHNP